MVACGGTEEFVKIVDIESKQEKAMLVHHKGSIVKIIEADSHLLVGSADGDISIWKLIQHDWTMVRALSTANSAVKCMSLHSSNRMLIAVSDKNILRLWNLMNCRCIYRRVLDPSTYPNIIDIQWLGDGPDYAILSSHLIHIISGDEELPPYQFQQTLECMIALSSGVLLIGGEKGLLCTLHYKENRIQYFEVKNAGRIKSLKSIEGYVIFISTTGIIGGFREAVLEEQSEGIKTIEMEFEFESGLRLLSLHVSDYKLKKRN